MGVRFVYGHDDMWEKQSGNTEETKQWGQARIPEKAGGRTEGKESHASTWSPEGSRDTLTIRPSRAFV